MRVAARGRGAWQRPAKAGTANVRAGITLLELLLALALTGVVMMIITMAIQLHLRTLDSRRADVEQSQVARAVLQHIAADIRNAVWYEPLDVSGIEELAAGGTSNAARESETGGQPEEETGTEEDRSSANQASEPANSPADAPSSADPSMQADDASSLDDLLGSELDGELSESVSDISTSLTPASVPGLYGNQFELQIDCSRLPRVDQYAMTVSSDPSAAPVVPSDTKTVAYFLRAEDVLQETADASVGSTANGLVRRELDRAATSFAAQDGSLDSSQYPGQLLAPEVNYLEFRYFDGSSWYTEWDSEQMQGLPVAIEITISIDPTAGRNTEELDVADVRELSTIDTDLYLYRLVVHIPVAKPAVVEDLSTMYGEELMP
jgi:type II secretory pathway pseudopilin PulG